jgi:hypothetical protein
VTASYRGDIFRTTRQSSEADILAAAVTTLGPGRLRNRVRVSVGSEISSYPAFLFD